jgi:hypothetical protein
MSNTISMIMLISIKAKDRIRILLTNRLDFFNIFIIAKNPKDANSKSIKGLWFIPKGMIVMTGKTRQ